MQHFNFLANFHRLSSFTKQLDKKISRTLIPYIFFLAVGCETFADGSPLLILDKTKCEEQSECLGVKEIRLSKTKCFLLPNKTQYIHNDTWKALEIKNGSFAITVEKVSLPNADFYLQWDLSKTPKSWGGLMVKVQFECEDSSASTFRKTGHCVVIIYTGTFKGKHQSRYSLCVRILLQQKLSAALL